MMKQPRLLIVSLGTALLCGSLLTPPQSSGQSDLLPAPNTLGAPVAPTAVGAPAAKEQAAVNSLAAEVLQQQAQIVANQKLIDDKLAIIAENLRIARIYVSRAK